MSQADALTLSTVVLLQHVVKTADKERRRPLHVVGMVRRQETVDVCNYVIGALALMCSDVGCGSLHYCSLCNGRSVLIVPSQSQKPTRGARCPDPCCREWMQSCLAKQLMAASVLTCRTRIMTQLSMTAAGCHAMMAAQSTTLLQVLDHASIIPAVRDYCMRKVHVRLEECQLITADLHDRAALQGLRYGGAAAAGGAGQRHHLPGRRGAGARGASLQLRVHQCRCAYRTVSCIIWTVGEAQLAAAPCLRSHCMLFIASQILNRPSVSIIVAVVSHLSSSSVLGWYFPSVQTVPTRYCTHQLWITTRMPAHATTCQPCKNPC